jgi:hypothetical protein
VASFSHLWSSALTRELGTDDSTTLFTDGRRQDAINHGVLAFADLTECAVRQSTVTSSHGIREYNLMASVNIPGQDFLRLGKQLPEYHFTDSGGHVTYLSGDDFPRRDVNWLNQHQRGWRDSTGGTPSAFYLRPDGGALYFGFDTPPDLGSSESGKVLLPYVAKPAVMSASTDVPFTFGSTWRVDLEPYHAAFVHHAAYELEKLRLNEAGSQTQWQLFLGYVERYLRYLRPKGGSQVRTARGYLTDARRARWRVTDGALADPWQ